MLILERKQGAKPGSIHAISSFGRRLAPGGAAYAVYDMSVKQCWVITDSAAGHQRQALALARQMRWPIRHLVLEPRIPWAWFAPRLLPASRYALTKAERTFFVPPWPALVIGCGRGAALFTRWLRVHTEGDCYSVQILDPRLHLRHWDTVIAPWHDRLHGHNVLSPLGSLNPVDDNYLAVARRVYPELARLPSPRTGVLLGGPRHGVPIHAAYARMLAQRLRQQWCHEGGSVLVVASPRTPRTVMRILCQVLDDVSGLRWFDRTDGVNPYAGVLAWSHRLVVTPDSVNMLSEACATGVAVYTLVWSVLPRKLERFHYALGQAGLLHELGDIAANPPVPLRETAAIAMRVYQRFISRT